MKTRSDYGIYPITAFSLVGLVIGFLSCGKHLRCGIYFLVFGMMLSGCTIPVVTHLLKAQSPDGVWITTPEELFNAPMIRIKTDDPILLRLLYNLQDYIVIEPRLIINDTVRFQYLIDCKTIWAVRYNLGSGKLLGAVYKSFGYWDALCYTEEVWPESLAITICNDLNRLLLRMVPKKRWVECGPRRKKIKRDKNVENMI